MKSVAWAKARIYSALHDGQKPGCPLLVSIQKQTPRKTCIELYGKLVLDKHCAGLKSLQLPCYKLPCTWSKMRRMAWRGRGIDDRCFGSCECAVVHLYRVGSTKFKVQWGGGHYLVNVKRLPPSSVLHQYVAGNAARVW